MKVYCVFFIDEHYCHELQLIYQDEAEAKAYVEAHESLGDSNFYVEEWPVIAS